MNQQKVYRIEVAIMGEYETEIHEFLDLDKATAAYEKLKEERNLVYLWKNF